MGTQDNPLSDLPKYGAELKKGRGMNHRVHLKSFNGTTTAPKECKAGENYWLLIGETGTTVTSKNEQSRFLVKFDISVASLGLHCHNPAENSLLIRESDLQFLD